MVIHYDCVLLKQKTDYYDSVIGKSFAIAIPLSALLAYIIWSCVKSHRKKKNAKKLARSWPEDRQKIASKMVFKPDSVK